MFCLQSSDSFYGILWINVCEVSKNTNRANLHETVLVHL